MRVEQVCILCFVQGYDVWSENVVNIKVGPFLIRRREDRKLRGVVTITANICGHPQPGFISIIKFGMNTFTGTLDILSTPQPGAGVCPEQYSQQMVSPLPLLLAPEHT